MKVEKLMLHLQDIKRVKSIANIFGALSATQIDIPKIIAPIFKIVVVRSTEPVEFWNCAKVPYFPSIWAST